VLLLDVLSYNGDVAQVVQHLRGQHGGTLSRRPGVRASERRSGFRAKVGFQFS